MKRLIIALILFASGANGGIASDDKSSHRLETAAWDTSYGAHVVALYDITDRVVWLILPDGRKLTIYWAEGTTMDKIDAGLVQLAEQEASGK
jgi:hypothetical protein